ncbi:MAG: zinc dependent phospholipase C family protein [Clostridia bacterium]|nr:zinc dependent phospholipase C family protein [Clostridia bacterium]
MPAIYTHVEFGEEVLEMLPPAFREVKGKYPEAFYLGTQGPDPLFYHKIMKKKAKNPVRKKGWDLHADSPELFFLNAAKRLAVDDENRNDLGYFTPNTAEAAYIIGFLCHFTLDSTCHPYIDECSVNGLTHAKIESEFDKFQFKKFDPNATLRGFNTAKLFYPNETAKKTSAKALNVPEKSMKKAMKSMYKINRLFSHKCGFVHGFCHTALTLVGKNRKLGDMFVHKKDDKRCKKINKNLSQSFNSAINVAALLIRDYFEDIDRFVADNKIAYECFRYNYSGVEV